MNWNLMREDNTKAVTTMADAAGDPSFYALEGLMCDDVYEW